MRLYSTLSRKKEMLPPPPGPVRMYFCGPTVYQRIHVGNARPFVVSMWLERWLQLLGYEVTLVENITDINDKIYAAAPGRSAQLAEQAARWYIEDTDGLGLGRPDHEPRASDTIQEIVDLIQQLIERDLAYQANGDVYFRVGAFAGYGALSGRRDDEEAFRNPSEESEESPRKQDPRDFALWKAHKQGEDTWWESPWGRGRPGWHIECSAMAEKFLGPAFEIHGGGLDLVFPHHENEIAQSRGAGRDFAKIWMHNGMLRLVGEKMSKSAGNVVSLRDVLDEWGRDTLLVFFLTAHWRKPLDFTPEAMESAKTQWESFRDAFRVVPSDAPAPAWKEFAAALDDDFSTPEALAIMHRWRAAGRLDLLRRGLEVFSLEPESADEAPAAVRELAERRRHARDGKEFDEADRLREEVARLGWEVQDVAEEPGFRLIPKR